MNWRTAEKLSKHSEVIAWGCRAADPDLVGGLTRAAMSGSVLGYIFFPPRRTYTPLASKRVGCLHCQAAAAAAAGHAVLPAAVNMPLLRCLSKPSRQEVVEQAHKHQCQ